MRANPRGLLSIGALVTAGLLITSCAASDGAATDAADADPVRIGNLAFTDSLLPTATANPYTYSVIQNVFDGLIRSFSDSGEVELNIATAIETDDAKTWTITISDDWTFHNGEQVTSSSFVDAWNAGADPDNAFTTASYFSGIEGYEDVVAGTADTLSGLEVVSDTEFVVTLSDVNSQFIYTLELPLFYPLPSVAFEDLDAYGRQPIGTGAYEVAEEWDGGEEIVLTAWDDYPGPDPAQNTGITFVHYESWDASWLDFQAGNLDITRKETLSDAEASSTGGRLVTAGPSSWELIRLPSYHGAYQDERIRQALSLAIDRETIAETLLEGSVVPLTDFSYPILIGYRDSVESANLTYDPELAKELYDAAGGIDGPVSLTTSSSWGSTELAEAILNGWRDVLGIEVGSIEAVSDTSTPLREQTATSPYVGRAPSYTPSPDDVLGRFYTSTGAGSLGTWSSAEFDELFAQARRESDPAVTEELYNEAKDILLEEIPDIPLWGISVPEVVSERVTAYEPSHDDRVSHREIVVSE